MFSKKRLLSSAIKEINRVMTRIVKGRNEAVVVSGSRNKMTNRIKVVKSRNMLMLNARFVDELLREGARRAAGL
jgi:hypothetical protein